MYDCEYYENDYNPEYDRTICDELQILCTDIYKWHYWNTCEMTDYFCSGEMQEQDCAQFNSQDECDKYAPYCDWTVSDQVTRNNLMDYGFINQNQTFVCQADIWNAASDNEYKSLTLSVV
jgi:hypothetical protein